ncbi:MULTISPECIES: hypothetical protein [Vibrio]|uniref:hypothetical protein n=1 Tax=Vibrio TaxID=662 RepID=UPI003D0F999A
MESKLNWITYKASTERDSDSMQDNGKNWLICTPAVLSECHSAPPCELSPKAFNDSFRHTIF